MEQLKQELETLIKQIPNEADFLLTLDALVSVYPFNEYEYVLSSLLGSGILTLDAYYDLRDGYIARNMFMYIFEISAPRTFGESWAQGHLKGLVPALEKPARKLDSNYSGQYDFFLDGQIRIEVKASRAVDAESDEPLYVKALAYASKRPFWMNFQQIKPGCCDVFVWIAVWRDVIHYWVLSSHEVENHLNYSKGQHRGNVGEGQIHIRQDNIAEFDKYRVPSDKLAEEIRKAYQTELKLRGKT